MIPEDNRFHDDPDGLLADSEHLIDGWRVEQPDPSDRSVVARLTHLLRAHERARRGWAGASVDDVLVEVSETGLRDARERRDSRSRRRDPRLGQRARPRRGADALRPRRRARPARRGGRLLLHAAVRLGRRAGPRRRQGPRPRRAADRHRRLRRRRPAARLAGVRRLREGPHLVPAEPPGRRRRGVAGARPGALGAGRRDDPAGPADRGGAAGRGRPPGGPPGPRVGLPRPLQLVGGDLRGVRAPAPRGSRSPLGPLVAGRARDPGPHGDRSIPSARSSAPTSRAAPAPTAPTSPTSASWTPPADAASPRRC